MLILKPKFKILHQGPGIDGLYQQIKTAGQTCYNSESAKTPSAFTSLMMCNGHGAMLEHGTVYLFLEVNTENCTSAYDYPEGNFTGNYNWSDVVGRIFAKYNTNPYSKVHTRTDGTFNAPVYRYYITTNLRVLYENDWMNDLKFWSEPTNYHPKRVTVRFTTQIAISREYNRHRSNSMAEQSTRYCNYSKAKYNSEISVVAPTWLHSEIFGENAHNIAVNLREMCQAVYLGNDNDEWNALYYWLFGNLATEYAYLNLIKLGKTPQEARTVLPLDTRTELVHTAFVEDWKHFFDLRALSTTGKPHPDAKILAEPLMEEFKRLNLI